jgi:hypothetical protein
MPKIDQASTLDTSYEILCPRVRLVHPRKKAVGLTRQDKAGECRPLRGLSCAFVPSYDDKLHF